MNAAGASAAPGSVPPGEVVTFYSYKGGTGRSMLLANVAWQLASAGERVLLMDWDLEAPGLHRYFRPFLGEDPELRRQDGVMQWLTDYWDACLDEPDMPVERLVREYADPRSYVRRLDVSAYLPGSIDLMGAGRQDSRYAESVADFDFTQLYQKLRGESFIDTAKQILVSAEGYDHVLVDSRTGVSDTSGFCTVALADTLVVCFTYNNQSVIGASQIARDIRHKAEQRRAAQVAAGTARRFRLFAVPSRVDPAEPERLEPRQRQAWGLFSDLVTDVASDQQTSYWLSVQIPNAPQFAYEEVLAACMNRPGDPTTVLGAVGRITQLLTDDAATAPVALDDDERRHLRGQFASLSLTAQARADDAGAPSAWARFMVHTPDAATRDALLQGCLAVLSQLVAGAPAGESGDPWVRTHLLESELTVDERRMAERLVAARLVQRRITDDRQRALVLADESILAQWEGLREHLRSESAFIAARERVREARRSWDTSGRGLAALRALQGDFARITLRDDQRGWMGRPNLQLLAAVQDLQDTEDAHLAAVAALAQREDEGRAALQELNARHLSLKESTQRKEAEFLSQAEQLRLESARAAASRANFKTASFGVLVVLGVIAVAGYLAAGRSASRIDDLNAKVQAAEQSREQIQRELTDSQSRLAASEQARALDAAYRHFQGGVESDDLARRRSGEPRAKLIQAALDAYTRAIDADARFADAYRARALTRSRAVPRDLNAEMLDWAAYYDLRRSLGGRTQLIVRAMTEPGIDPKFIDSQLIELRKDAVDAKARDIRLAQAIDQLEAAVNFAAGATRSVIQRHLEQLRQLPGAEPASRTTGKPGDAQRAAIPAPKSAQPPAVETAPAPAAAKPTTRGMYPPPTGATPRAPPP